MRFFIPGIDDLDEAERFYVILGVLAAGRTGPLSRRRIRSIIFSRGRELHTATVGEADTSTGLPCVAIFEAARGGLCAIYTEGAISQTGHLVGPPHHVEAFDDVAAP
jgi:hypothetical protein